MNVFECHTPNGYSWRVLTEILNNNFKNICMTIGKDGINIKNMDFNRTIAIDINIESKKFKKYILNNPKKMYISIQASYLHKVFKTIRKKEAIKLIIPQKDQTKLTIVSTLKDSTRASYSTIRITPSQNLNLGLPDNYEKCLVLNASEYQRMCKDQFGISPTTQIEVVGNKIFFTNNSADIIDKKTEFGDGENEADSDDDSDSDEKFDEIFDTKILSKISKISGLTKLLRFYAKNGNPLKVSADIELGSISVYIKSKKLQEKDQEEQGTES